VGFFFYTMSSDLITLRRKLFLYTAHKKHQIIRTTFRLFQTWTIVTGSKFLLRDGLTSIGNPTLGLMCYVIQMGYKKASQTWHISP